MLVPRPQRKESTSILRSEPALEIQELPQQRLAKATRDVLSDVLEWTSLIGTICSAAALAIFWVFAVPIFQSPDEPAHSDYVFSLAHAGHLLRADDGISAEIADPDIKYLSAAVETNRIAFHPENHVPADYATPAYKIRINTHAPAIAQQYYDVPDHPVPWLITVYPFGFYAAAALWVRVISTELHSLTGQFFAARLFSVGLLCLSLGFTYWTFRGLAVGVCRSLLLTFAIGAFPMVTFVSSYVQPDNLSFTLVAMCFYITTRMKNRGATMPLVICTGLLLAALMLTKIQFAVALVVPIAAFIAVERWGLRAWQRRWPAVLCAVFVPTIAAFALNTAIVHKSHTDSLPGIRFINTASLAAARATGTVPQYLVDRSVRAFDDYFNGGSTQVSYWGVFGWLDAPLVIGNVPTEQALAKLTDWTTVAVIVALAIVVVRRLRSIVSLARRGRLYLAARALCGNPILNSYLAFSVLMLSMYVVYDNTFGAQGRNWIPFMAAALLVAVREAPAMLRVPKSAQRLSTFMLAFFVVFALAGSAYAGATIRDRYYDRSVATLIPKHIVALNRPGLAVIDEVAPALPGDGARQPASGPNPPVYARAGAPLYVRGWAADADTRLPAAAVFVTIDDRVVLRANYGLLRPDVAAAYGQQMTSVGFSGTIGTQGLPEGRHQIGLHVIDAPAIGYYAVPASRTIVLVK